MGDPAQIARRRSFNYVIYYIAANIVRQYGKRLSERLCTMERRFYTVKDYAEHGVFRKGSSECSVQRNEEKCPRTAEGII